MVSIKSLWFSFAAAGILTAAASAATLTAGPVAWSGAVPGSTAANVPQFDDLGGTLTLTKVTVILNATIGADVTGENDSASAGSMSMNLSGNAIGSAPGTTLFAIVVTSAGPISVAATDGTAGSGPDFHDFGTVSGSDSDNDILLSGFGPYIGVGTVPVSVALSGGFNISGVSDSTLHVSGFAASGDATIIYEYTPEPTALALLGFGSIFLARRRRTA